MQLAGSSTRRHIHVLSQDLTITPPIDYGSLQELIFADNPVQTIPKNGNEKA
jgi:hypothetical protein